MNELQDVSTVQILYNLAKKNNNFLTLFCAVAGWSDDMTDTFIIEQRHKKAIKETGLTL